MHLNATSPNADVGGVGPQTKIVATLGPASSDIETIRALERAGVDVFRLNCSHLSTTALKETIATVREATTSAAILVDIQGPKLRTGAHTLALPEGADVWLESGDLEFSPLEIGVRVGEEMLLGDGTFKLLIKELEPARTLVEVRIGGDCPPRRGVNLPESQIRMPGIGIFSEKDLADIEAARQADVEWLALSFVGEAGDVEAAREFAGDMGIIAKIERRVALDNLESIARAADGLMAARGDLGVELPFYDVPRAQQRIAECCLRLGKASICATEMLESMRTNTRPTRAEVSDVSMAISEGYGAVMLSAETSIGLHPVTAVRAMRTICEHNEIGGGNKVYADAHPADTAVAAAAVALATRIKARSILALTFTGFSARIISGCRPPCNVIAATPSAKVARQLRLYRGVGTIIVERDPDLIKATEDAVTESRSRGMTRNGDDLVIAASRANPSTPADTIWQYRVE